MKGGLKASGFTIIETLIVLAISGSMLVAVVAMISGQQGKTQFQQSINQVSQQIQQIIGDVSNGYYPVSNISCSATGSSISISTAPGNSIGTNSDCVLVGKVIQFYQTQTSAPQQYTVYSMVGSRAGNGAYPIAIAPGILTHKDVPPGNTTVTSLANGISLAYTAYTDIYGFTQTNSSEAFGILTSPVSGSGATDTSGAQQINIYAIKGTSATSDSFSNVDVIDKQPTNFVQITSYSICLISGTTNQSGLITIGGGSRKVSVVLTIKDGKKC